MRSVAVLLLCASAAALTPYDGSRMGAPTARPAIAQKKKNPELVAATTTMRTNLGINLGIVTPQLALAMVIFSVCGITTVASQAVQAAASAAVEGAAPAMAAAATVAAEAATEAAKGATKAAAKATTLSAGEIFKKASKRALGGGFSGAIAGVIQVCTLMWLRTTMNYQYRYGTSTSEAMAALWAQGGVGRFYQGLPYALMQAPLSRFGDTAANTGVLAIFEAMAPDMPIGIKTACASSAGSLWRILITPIDTLKTTLQVEGATGMALLQKKMAADGAMILYNGAIANAVASFVGSFPWYFTFNWLQEVVPKQDQIALKLLRNALCGFGATCVSDVVSNVIRVLKTTVQTSEVSMGYLEAAQEVIEKEGVIGLFTRGLGTRLMTNGIQASLFSVLWKLFEDAFAKKGL